MNWTSMIYRLKVSIRILFKLRCISTFTLLFISTHAHKYSINKQTNKQKRYLQSMLQNVTRLSGSDELLNDTGATAIDAAELHPYQNTNVLFQNRFSSFTLYINLHFSVRSSHLFVLSCCDVQMQPRCL